MQHVQYNFNFEKNYSCVEKTGGMYVKMLTGFTSKWWHFRLFVFLLFNLSIINIHYFYK